MAQSQSGIMEGTIYSNSDPFKFSFQNMPLSQKYTLVNIYPEKRIINQDVSSLPVVNKVTDFFKKQSRPSFVTINDPPNEQRFNPSESLASHNTIHHFTNRGQRALDIGKVSSRDENLILKGGEAGRDLSIHVAPNYEPNKEIVMSQSIKQALDFKKINHRTQYRSIYRKESSPDYYDSKKISTGYN